MDTALTAASVFFIAVSWAPLLPSSHWLVRVWEFPRLQIAAIISLLLIGYAFKATYYAPLNSLSLILVVGLIVSLIYQVVWIIPYTPLYKREVKRVGNEDTSRKLSVLSSNVYMPNNDFRKLIEHVRNKHPDFLVTLESNEKWQKGISEIESEYPYRKFCPLENLYGMHLYSKIPFEEATLRFMIEDDVPSMRVKINHHGQDILLYFLHPKPPSPTENTYAKPRDVELTVVGEEIAKTEGPIIVAGDLNDVAWSPTTRKFKKISGLLDPREGRGFFNTFHAKYPLVKWPLDHVFHSKHFGLVNIEKLEGVGSDHYPLYTELALMTDKE
ncbi:endonuclease/exonuclease/phosphatase family protein [Alteromonas sp. PRIM-21]|uniref:endonuclease/exonuclease/phosphatase family protein n=1 Tax=Alteromonas sp. PRIM-21 TaxID=1454978 RepID=UPI0022B9696F|nr:endonuclease/exonuclease/phosphatase family protein [Alteromonas sp. PRIM-21]MCZ8530554.1 endonuclease/exonuclease/phosphatase family protein [Alteromonas sp. PRIM-21]